MTIGEMLRARRLKNELTLRQVEAKSGLDNSVISQIETGRSKEPSFRAVVKIARSLRVSLSALAKLVK